MKRSKRKLLHAVRCESILVSIMLSKWSDVSELLCQEPRREELS